MLKESLPIQVHSKEEKMLDQQDWVGRKLVDERSIVFHGCQHFQSKRRSFNQIKVAQWMRQLIIISENASLKFLMPSRRHHPQVEPLLATYKICYSKRWLKFFGAFKEQILLQKALSLEDSLRPHASVQILLTMPILHSGILLIS